MSESDKNVDSDEEDDNQDLFFVKQLFKSSKMKVKMHMSNMEMWILDYKKKLDQRAQILQLKFIQDISMNDTKKFRDLLCSRVKIERDGSSHEDDSCGGHDLEKDNINEQELITE